MAEFKEILFEVRDRVATITLNRPEKRNAWSAVMEAEIREAFGLATRDPEARCIVLTGAGKAFCVGAEMKNLAAKAESGGHAAHAAPAHPSAAKGNFEQRYSYLLDVPKPILCAINGGIAGVGFAVALYCDIRYMVAGTRMSSAFARRGLAAEHAAAWMLPRLIGPMNASDILLSGRAVTAEEAASMGLVRVLPGEGFQDAVHAIAAEYANLSSPRAMGVIKRQIVMSPFQSLAEATEMAEKEVAKCRSTEDYREGVASFAEKRNPNFSGR